MAKIFAIITTVLLLFAGYLGLKNSEALSTELTNGKATDDKLTKSKAELADKKQKVEQAIKETEAAEAERRDTEKQRDDMLVSNSELTKQLDELKAQVESNKKKIAENEGANQGDPEELVAKLKATQSKLATLESEITESEAKLANLSTENTSLEKQVQNYRDTFQQIASKQSKPSLKTSIRSVYGQWGFVTLNGGNAAGIVGGSTLQVMRDGEVVAKLLVTSVEPGSAAADVVPDSIKEGTVIEAGDTVVPAPPEAPTTAPAPAPAAPAAPAPNAVPAPPAPAAPAPATEDPFGIN